MEAIKTRRSIRNYTGELLNESHKSYLQNYIKDEQNLTGPLGNKIRIVYIETSDSPKSGKIGTYGFIKNAPSFLICICKNNKENLIDVGYVFEKLVLSLESKGIGTCWIGGTFDRKKLQTKHSVSENEFIPIISPVGYPAEKKHTFEKVIRRVAKSDNRKDFDEMFFDTAFENKISEKAKREMLEYVRLAPSASNKQPWRIVINNDKAVHFFMERTAGYGNSLGYDIQMVDMGIALSHYMIINKNLCIANNKPHIELPNDRYEYVISLKPIVS